MKLYREHFNAKCVSFSTTLQEQLWQNLLSLEIGIGLQEDPLLLEFVWTWTLWNEYDEKSKKPKDLWNYIVFGI